MRHSVKIATATLLIILLGTCGCRKWPENGKLDGMWQIMSIDYSDGSSTGRKKYYYNFQRSLCELEGIYSCVGNMIYDENSHTIHISFPETELSRLLPYGISVNPVAFNITELTNTTLVLSNEYSTITFRKF